MAEQAVAVFDKRHPPLQTKEKEVQALQQLQTRIQSQAVKPLDLQVYADSFFNAVSFANNSVRFSNTLVRAFSAREITAVLAHELGHLLLGHAEQHIIDTELAVSKLDKDVRKEKALRALLDDEQLITQEVSRAQYSLKEEAAADIFATEFLKQEGIPITTLLMVLRTLASSDRTHQQLLAHRISERLKILEQKF